MYLAIHGDRLCTVKEVAKYYNISQNHLVKVVHRLSQLGYIKSSKGKGGGICLLKKPENINLKELVVNLEPNLTLVECFDDANNNCFISNVCGLKKIMHESLDAFTDTLGKYTVADTISQPNIFPIANKDS